MNVLILGDSLAFPRHSKQQSFQDAWPSQLQAALPRPTLWQRARQGATSRDALNELRMLAEYFGPSRPFELIVVQVGIVDCCPRPLPALATKILPRLPLGQRLQKFVNRHHRQLLKLRSKPWISLEAYRQNLSELIKIAEPLTERLVLIAIAPPAHNLLANAPGITEQVQRYNDALRALASDPTNACKVHFLDPYGSTPEPAALLLQDGHHLTLQGHTTLASELRELLAVEGLVTEARL